MSKLHTNICTFICVVNHRGRNGIDKIGNISAQITDPRFCSMHTTTQGCTKSKARAILYRAEEKKGTPGSEYAA